MGRAGSGPETWSGAESVQEDSVDPKRTVDVVGRLVALGTVCPGDDRLHYQIWRDEEVQQGFNAPLPWPTFESWLAFWSAPERPPRRYVGTILRLPEEKPVGFVSLAPAGREPDLAIVLEAGSRGRGLGTEAMRFAADHVVRAFGLPYVVAGAFEHNRASLRMLEKAGFVRAPEEDVTEENRFGPGEVRQLGWRRDRPSSG